MKELDLSQQPRNRCGAQTGINRITGLLLLMGALIAPQFAYAGEYVFDRLETEDGETYESTRNPTTEPWYPGSLGSASVYDTGSSVSVSARSSGKVRAVFKWQGDDPQDNPPQDSVLYAKVTSMAYLGVSGEQFYDIEISNGLGAPVVNYTSQSVGLLQAKTNGQQEVKMPYITLKAKGRAEGNDGAWVGAYLSYNAERDNRGLKLTRPGAVWEWEDSDGNIHGDTTYSFVAEYLGDPPSENFPNVQTFVASLSGNWSPNNQFVFAPTPETINSTGNGGFSVTYTMPYGNLD